MCDWVIQAGELLRPITASMRLELLTGDYIQADKAPLMVQGPGLGRNYRAHLWQYSRPRGSLVFDFQMGRGREGPRNHLTGRNLPAPYLSANNRSSGTKPQPPRFIITSRSSRSNRAVKVTILPSRFPLQLSLGPRFVFEAHARHRREVDGRLAVDDPRCECLSHRRRD